jgi:hypothetical protein
VVLKNEFKKMMREARVENQKQLRVSCPHFRHQVQRTVR